MSISIYEKTETGVRRARRTVRSDRKSREKMPKTDLVSLLLRFTLTLFLKRYKINMFVEKRRTDGLPKPGSIIKRFFGGGYYGKHQQSGKNLFL